MKEPIYVDVRTRVITLVVLNLICSISDPFILGFTSILIILYFIYQKASINKLLRELRYYFIFLLAVGITRSISVDGVELFRIGPAIITLQGLESGAVFCWKLTLIVIMGVLFIQNSHTFEIKAAIQWFLTPLPLIKEKQVAILLSLMLRFIPSIVHEANEIREAQVSRSINNRMNPLYRIVYFIRPLLLKTFSSVNDLSDAMESRNFCLDRTEPELKFTNIDTCILLSICAYGLWAINFSLG